MQPARAHTRTHTSNKTNNQVLQEGRRLLRLPEANYKSSAYKCMNVESEAWTAMCHNDGHGMGI